MKNKTIEQSWYSVIWEIEQQSNSIFPPNGYHFNDMFVDDLKQEPTIDLYPDENGVYQSIEHFK